jgi:hypothetical protein
MKNLWGKFSDLSRYYFISILSFLVLWTIFYALKVEFINGLFFTTSFVWHFTLLTPGIREKVLSKKQRFSFLTVIIRINYYLQLFIKIKNFKYGPAVIRAISPFLFTLILVVAGGSGNLLFTLLGSAFFESVYSNTFKKVILERPDDLETPPMIPIEENSHE